MTSLSVAFDRLLWCLCRLSETELCELRNCACPGRSKQLWPSSCLDVEQCMVAFWRTKDRVKSKSWLSADIRSTPVLANRRATHFPLVSRFEPCRSQNTQHRSMPFYTSKTTQVSVQ